MKKYSFWRASHRTIARQRKELCILFVIAIALFALTLPKETEPYIETPPIQKFEPVEPVPQPTTTPIKRLPVQVAKWTPEQETLVEQKLAEKFTPEDATIALAVLKAESHLQVRAVGYNCFYDQYGNVQEVRGTSTRSKSCLPEHRNLAWSVDCGIIMLNRIGQNCNEEDFDLESSIEKMYELYSKRQWQPWVVYNTGAYIKYLEM